MGISVTRCHTANSILPVVVSCFTDIVEDDTNEDALINYINVYTDCWLKIKRGNILLGFVEFSPYNRTMLEIHPFIKKEHRQESQAAVQAAITWVIDNSPNMYKSLITSIPTCKRYATLFARKMEFKEVGRYKGGFTKDNKQHDIVLYQRGIR